MKDENWTEAGTGETKASWDEAVSTHGDKAGTDGGGKTKASWDADGGGETKASWDGEPVCHTIKNSPFTAGGDADDEEIVPGQVIFGRYEVVELLGRGGMGYVWLVNDRKFNAPRAMKLIVSGIAYDAQARARFAREAFVMAQISHPNAVIIHDAELTDQDLAYIVMEYIKGRGLDKLIGHGAVASPEWAARVLDQLCDVLQVAHDRGIIHRDLKPSNLMLLDDRAEGKEHLKVLDFGIAKIRDEGSETELHTAAGAFIGTPPYAAPEQAVGQADARSDIYAVGVILFELLTGQRPFAGPIHKLIFDTQFTPPPGFSAINPEVRVPESVERVVLRCLDKDPDRRPQTPRALAEEFLAALGRDVRVDRPHTPATEDATESPGVEDPAPPRRRRAALAVVTLAGALCATAGLAWAVWHKPVNPKVTIADTPKPARPPISLPKGFEAFRDEVRSPVVGGYPQVLVQKDGGARLFRHPAGFYLPEGYEPEGAASALSSAPGPDGWPAVIVRKSDGVRFCRLDGGTFRMGAFDRPAPGPADTPAENQPAHPVRVSSFYMQEFEVTNGELEAYFALARVDPKSNAKEWLASLYQLASDTGLPKEQLAPYPAVEVDHGLAREYARFRQGRLPREAEWEYAARSGGKDVPFVWGDQPASKDLANIHSAGDDNVPFLPLRQYADRYPLDRTGQGVRALTGNVREWCEDRWGPYHAEDPPPRDPRGPTAEGSGFVIRGGSSYDDLLYAPTTFRSRSETDFDTRLGLGFRVVLGDLPPRLTAAAAVTAR